MYNLKKFLYFCTFFTIINFSLTAAQENFDSWLTLYKSYVLKKGVSQATVDNFFKNARYLEQVLVYDRKQPEFFEDTNTYVGKRATKSRMSIALKNIKKIKHCF